MMPASMKPGHGRWRWPMALYMRRRRTAFPPATSPSPTAARRAARGLPSANGRRPPRPKPAPNARTRLQSHLGSPQPMIGPSCIRAVVPAHPSLREPVHRRLHQPVHPSLQQLPQDNCRREPLLPAPQPIRVEIAGPIPEVTRIGPYSGVMIRETNLRRPRVRPQVLRKIRVGRAGRAQAAMGTSRYSGGAIPTISPHHLRTRPLALRKTPETRANRARGATQIDRYSSIGVRKIRVTRREPQQPARQPLQAVVLQRNPQAARHLRLHPEHRRL